MLLVVLFETLRTNKAETIKRVGFDLLSMMICLIEIYEFELNAATARIAAPAFAATA